MVEEESEGAVQIEIYHLEAQRRAAIEADEMSAQPMPSAVGEAPKTSGLSSTEIPEIHPNLFTMAEKHLVCHGALCRCRFGTASDRLKVASQDDHYINDGGTQKLTANTLDLGNPFAAGTFGTFSVANGGPCVPAITAWLGAYPKVTLSNGGKVLVEDSKAT